MRYRLFANPSVPCDVGIWAARMVEAAAEPEDASPSTIAVARRRIRIGPPYFLRVLCLSFPATQAVVVSPFCITERCDNLFELAA